MGGSHWACPLSCFPTPAWRWCRARGCEPRAHLQGTGPSTCTGPAAEPCPSAPFTEGPAEARTLCRLVGHETVSADLELESRSPGLLPGLLALPTVASSGLGQGGQGQGTREVLGTRHREQLLWPKRCCPRLGGVPGCPHGLLLRLLGTGLSHPNHPHAQLPFLRLCGQLPQARPGVC